MPSSELADISTNVHYNVMAKRAFITSNNSFIMEMLNMVDDRNAEYGLMVEMLSMVDDGNAEYVLMVEMLCMV